ncbi:hypothetical protein [Rhizobium sp. RU36D]|uniref:hypothetical protein n=1 Tax=Rhizobium sp. RU36D TaxID=1907415 RepID=UPI0009D8F4F1|nr:hypothetical protein [Rhizobium sp. RU36D]SMC43185.1 hypothetical protein SAMN05880593_101285 [Rhizobium sp. RU36D]
MKSYATVGAVSMFAALGAAIALLAWDGTKSSPAMPDIDPITSASVPSAQPTDQLADDAITRFTVSNLDTDTVCLVERGKSALGRGTDFSAEADCEAVWPGLAAARSWIENGDGSVTLTDERGTAVLTMGTARGFDYATIEPSGVDITWLQLP